MTARKPTIGSQLTGPQAYALFVLLKARALGWLADGASHTYEYSFRLSVNTRCAAKLVALGLAQERNVLPDGTEVKGANLVHYLGSWKTKYVASARGARTWKHMSVRERYGLDEYPELCARTSTPATRARVQP